MLSGRRKIKKQKQQKNVYVNLSNTNYIAVSHCVTELGYLITESRSQCVLFWCDQGGTSEFLNSLESYQVYNHFPGMWAIARKVDMGRNLERMKRFLPDAYNFLPKSFILPNQAPEMTSYMQSIQKKSKRTFIIKPDRGSLGRGIILTQDPDFSESYNESALAQQYISPYLIDNLKFDLRIYALVTSCDPLRLYIHDEGLARFCTEPYEKPNSSNLDNYFSHLTNYSLNKKNENFNGNAESGHKRPMSTIFNDLASHGYNVPKLQDQIDEIIRLTLASIQPFLANNYRASVKANDEKSRCFEILGFDILLDKRATPYLLEVNYMPMLDIDTEFDKVLKFSLINGALRILDLYPGFKKDVITRVKAETQKRLNGTTDIPIVSLFDPVKESKIAETTHWRQIYPISGSGNSVINDALKYSKMSPVGASIETTSFRTRRDQAQAYIKELSLRDKEPFRKHYHKEKQIPMKPVCISTTQSFKKQLPPLKLIPLDEFESANPIQIDQPKNEKESIPFFAHYPDLPPEFINKEEEEERLKSLGKQKLFTDQNEMLKSLKLMIQHPQKAHKEVKIRSELNVESMLRQARYKSNVIKPNVIVQQMLFTKY